MDAKTKTLRDVKRLAAKLGASVEDEKIGNSHECRVMAPTGKTWVSDPEAHELIDHVFRPWKPEYTDLLDRMAEGVEDCVIPDCDWCNES